MEGRMRKPTAPTATLLQTMKLIEIQLSYNHAPDAAMQQVMLNAAREAITKTEGSIRR